MLKLDLVRGLDREDRSDIKVAKSKEDDCTRKTSSNGASTAAT